MVAQISLALVSLVGALLFVRTFVNLDSYAIGFDPRPIMTMRVFMAGEAGSYRYDTAADRPSSIAFISCPASRGRLPRT